MGSNIRITRICQYCGKEFEARMLQTRYCSHYCNAKHYKEKKRQEKLEEALNPSPEKKILSLPGEATNYKYKDYFSVDEAADYIGISRRTIYRLIKNKDLKVHKLGGRTIIKKSSIEALF